MSDKIQRHHLERKAVLYVRQSSVHQVLHNRESGALQYAMRDRLLRLGFTQIDTIDEDLGRSASGSAERAGFDRMVATKRLSGLSATGRSEARSSFAYVAVALGLEWPRKSPTVFSAYPSSTSRCAAA